MGRAKETTPAEPQNQGPKVRTYHISVLGPHSQGPPKRPAPASARHRPRPRRQHPSPSPTPSTGPAPAMENRKPKSSGVSGAPPPRDDLRAAASCDLRRAATPWRLRHRDVLRAAAPWHLRQRAASPAGLASHGQATPPSIRRTNSPARGRSSCTRSRRVVSRRRPASAAP
jgi:hypothetical protein